MKQAAEGDTVQVHYTGTLEDGATFDSSEDRGPMEITIGSGQVLPGVENALAGMAEGEVKKVTLPEDEAFGPHNPQLIHEIERTHIPDEVQIEKGAVLEATGENGQPIRLIVIDYDDANVTLDANHPLAGKTLTFELTLVGFAS